MSTEQVYPSIEPDTDFFDEGFSQPSDASSYLTSIATEIRKGIEENGRTYAALGKHLSALPVDEEEQARNDLQHYKFLLLLEDRLFLSPICEEPSHILDLGTGSGIWAIDMADKFPSSIVLGVDLAPVQPTWIPSNCQFEVDDIEEDWLHQREYFDFIHARELVLAIRDWDKLIRQAYNHLKPGGWLELSLSVPEPLSDDGTLPPDSAHCQNTAIFMEIGKKIGAPPDVPKQFKSKMELGGFVEVKETRYKVPSSPWPKNKRLKRIGAIEAAHLSVSVEAFLMRGMVGVLGRSKEEVQVQSAQLVQDLRNPSIHSYYPHYVVIGRKPFDSKTAAGSG